MQYEYQKKYGSFVELLEAAENAISVAAAAKQASNEAAAKWNAAMINRDDALKLVRKTLMTVACKRGVDFYTLALDGGSRVAVLDKDGHPRILDLIQPNTDERAEPASSLTAIDNEIG